MLRSASLLVLCTGCLRDAVTVFPDGMGPLEDNRVPGLADDATEGVSFVTGDDDGLLWVHGRGMVHAPVVDVFAALQDPAVVQDRRGVDEWVPEHDVEEGFDVSFAIHCTTREIITVEWTTTWRESVIDGDLEDPEVVAVRYQKTDGPAILAELEGSIIARERDSDRTEIEFEYRLQAPRTSEADLLCYQQDLFDEVVLTTRGRPLPEYTESCR